MPPRTNHDRDEDHERRDELKAMIDQSIGKAFGEIRQDVHDIRNEVRGMKESMYAVNRFITGNGDPDKGATVRLDRLEQKDKSRAFWTNTAIGAALSAIVAAVAGLIFKH